MSDDTYQKPPHGWTCFHCGETFTTPGSARDHFGGSIDAEPGCLIRVQLGDERGLLYALRQAEADLARYRNEDSDTDRAMHAMRDDHQRALLREEEKGYARGLADGRIEPTPFCGYTLEQAAQAAVDAGSIEAWEWFKAWYNADLQLGEPGPDGKTR